MPSTTSGTAQRIYAQIYRTWKSTESDLSRASLLRRSQATGADRILTPEEYTIATERQDVARAEAQERYASSYQGQRFGALQDIQARLAGIGSWTPQFVQFGGNFGFLREGADQTVYTNIESTARNIYNNTIGKAGDRTREEQARILPVLTGGDGGNGGNDLLLPLLVVAGGVALWLLD